MNAIDEYINGFEPEIVKRLQVLRQLIFQVYPKTAESIRYKMPAFKVGVHYVYFAAYKKHIGFYPVYGMPDLEPHLELYRAKKTKDSLHFLHEKPLPLELIKMIVIRKSKLKQELPIPI